METAYKLYSWKGLCTERVDASKIKSPSDARKLGPFVDENKFPLTWVNWSKPKSRTGKKTPPYFRYYPNGRIKGRKYKSLEEEIDEIKEFSESEIHKKARKEITQYLNNLIESKKPLEWSFKDDSISDFSLTGDLLSEVVKVVTPYKYKTPFGVEYEFDVALLGKTLKEPLLLGAIEIEKTHKFGFLKLLISKSLGFPLVSINMEDYRIEDIDKDWCSRILGETTHNSEDGLRRNYFYIHNALYPVYINIPDKIRQDEKHQFLIFCKDSQFDDLNKTLKGYKKALGLLDSDVGIQTVKVNKNEPTSLKMISNEGSIAGSDWRQFNSEKYIRVVTKIPREKRGDLYLFHLVMARLNNAYFETLVGYKYRQGISNEDHDDPIWTSTFFEKRIVPKHLSEPINYVIDHLKEHGLIDKVVTGASR